MKQCVADFMWYTQTVLYHVYFIQWYLSIMTLQIADISVMWTPGTVPNDTLLKHVDNNVYHQLSN